MKIAIICMALLLSSNIALAETLTFKDAKGDDNGGGKLTYPSGKEYVPGSFDIVKVEIREDGDDVVFEVELAVKVTDPWMSEDWGGNGFSLQFVQIYIDTDGKRRKGERKGVPGSWIEFTPDSYYEKVVLISPQPSAKLNGEIGSKAKLFKKRVVVPSRTEARGKSIIARVPKKAIGTPSKKWGVQAIMLSNEGFAAKQDVLSRKVNEMAGEHRFGGGCDGFGDPQVTDMLNGKAQGTPAEVAEQHKLLGKYKCNEDPRKAKVPKISMVRL